MPLLAGFAAQQCSAPDRPEACTTINGNNAPVPDPRDEFTLLCERCGYVIEDLPRDGPCPECGTPIAESLPERRPGSPWQQRPGFAAWLRTCVAVLTGPIAFWNTVRVEPLRTGFGWANVWAAAMIFVAVTVARVMREYSYSGRGPDEAFPWWMKMVGCGAAAGWVLLLLMLAVAGLVVLTAVEGAGVRFFGRRRGWRVTPAVAHTVCWHASIGWPIGVVLWGAGALAVDTGLVQRTLRTVGLATPYTSAWIRALLPATGFFIGLLVFEFLVYFGVRRNRFANQEHPSR